MTYSCIRCDNHTSLYCGDCFDAVEDGKEAAKNLVRKYEDALRLVYDLEKDKSKERTIPFGFTRSALGVVAAKYLVDKALVSNLVEDVWCMVSQLLDERDQLIAERDRLREGKCLSVIPNTSASCGECGNYCSEACFLRGDLGKTASVA